MPQPFETNEIEIRELEASLKRQILVTVANTPPRSLNTDLEVVIAYLFTYFLRGKGVTTNS